MFFGSLLPRLNKHCPNAGAGGFWKSNVARKFAPSPRGVLLITHADSLSLSREREVVNLNFALVYLRLYPRVYVYTLLSSCFSHINTCIYYYLQKLLRYILSQSSYRRIYRTCTLFFFFFFASTGVGGFYFIFTTFFVCSSAHRWWNGVLIWYCTRKKILRRDFKISCNELFDSQRKFFNVRSNKFLNFIINKCIEF